MIKITIEIKQLEEGSRKAMNIALRAEKEQPTPLEKQFEERILPAVRDMLKNCGLLGERA